MSRSNGSRHRPRRGPSGPNVLVTGDTGPRQPQGGARDVARDGPSESGDLQAREFGVPQADIPGGLKHLVNPQTHVDSPAPKPLRPADYHKEHGVEPDDWGQYELPPDESEHVLVERPVHVQQMHDAVPVYEVEHPGKLRTIRTTACYTVNIRAAGQEPSRICNRDPDRVEVLILNEDSSTDIRVSEKFSELQLQSAAGTGPADVGALIWHGTNSYTRIKTQEQLFGITTGSASARLSVMLIIEIPETAGID